MRRTVSHGPIGSVILAIGMFITWESWMKGSESRAGELNAGVRQYVSARLNEFADIGPERRAELESLAGYVRERIAADQPVKLTFVCTHNSRRSHLSQLWAAVAAVHYGIDDIATFSGGTEATAMNPRTVDALRRAGMTIDADDPAAINPRYRVRFGDPQTDQTCFSKVYDESPNPNSGYAAVMTCSHADENCPLVRGCDFRIAIRYDDPKLADETPAEAATYDERSRQIAREMLYLMSQVALR
jgi:arsenate reductase